MSTDAAAVIDRFGDRKVLVLGDMVADEYILGRPDRISREAPVLILDHSSTFIRPGGATNTAHNLARLGASTAVVGLIGDDALGRELSTTLAAIGIDTGGLLVDPQRQTSTKTRIIAMGTQQEVQQQVVRIDRIDTSSVSAPIRDRMIDIVCRSLPRFDSLLISDYENGVISPEVIEACLPRARELGLTIVVDSHGDLLRFKGVTAATPNQPEAAATWGAPIRTDKDLEAAGAEILAGMEAHGVLITRGSEGLVLFERDQPPYALPISLARESQVVDPAGAGDTVAAVFTLALASGASMRLAAFLGNIGGGEVVQKLGTATLTNDELAGALRHTHLPLPR